jgi:hypothetical protein
VISVPVTQASFRPDYSHENMEDERKYRALFFGVDISNCYFSYTYLR